MLIGTIELDRPAQPHLTDPLTGWISGINLHNFGLVIVGLFVVTWTVAIALADRGRTTLAAPHGRPTDHGIPRQMHCSNSCIRRSRAARRACCRAGRRAGPAAPATTTSAIPVTWRGGLRAFDAGRPVQASRRSAGSSVPGMSRTRWVSCAAARYLQRERQHGQQYREPPRRR